jgi:hypothetical protein
MFRVNRAGIGTDHRELRSDLGFEATQVGGRYRSPPINRLII